MAVPKAAWLAVEELPVSRVKLDGARTFGPGLQAGTFAGAAASTSTLLPARAVSAATAEPGEDALAHEPVLASGPAVAGEPLEAEPVLDDQPVVADEPVVADGPVVADEPVVAGEPIVEAEALGGAEPPTAAEPALAGEPEPSPGPVELAQSQALSQLTQAMLRTLAAQARQGARGSGLGRPAGLSSAMPAPAAQPAVAKGKGPGPEPPAANDSSGPTSSQGAAGNASDTAPEAPSTPKAPSAAVARALSLLAGAGEPAGQASREAEVPAGPAEEALTGAAPQGQGEPKNDLPKRDPRQDDILPTRKKGLNLRLRLR
jgi:hypothetical protein